MEVLGYILGGVIFVVVILWLLVTVGSFLVAWVSLVMLIMEAETLRRSSKVAEVAPLKNLRDGVDSYGNVLTDGKLARRRRRLIMSASIFVISMLSGSVVALVFKKIQG